ncbi:MAG: response regulator [Deltaproteobacteria bacterium]|nr:response regulator [Deltaproteobacteria bacterium]
MKCLAIDDSSTVRLALKLVLESQGYKMDMAVDGEDAMRKIRVSSDFDLIITDINMPNMDGLAFIKEIRTFSNYSSTPILVVSTETKPEKMEEGKKAGASGWIAKPFKPNELISILKSIKEKVSSQVA